MIIRRVVSDLAGCLRASRATHVTSTPTAWLRMQAEPGEALATKGAAGCQEGPEGAVAVSLVGAGKGQTAGQEKIRMEGPDRSEAPRGPRRERPELRAAAPEGSDAWLAANGLWARRGSGGRNDGF